MDSTGINGFGKLCQSAFLDGETLLCEEHVEGKRGAGELSLVCAVTFEFEEC